MAYTRGMAYMKRAVNVSLFCNIVLVTLKAVALIIVNSLAIAVDLGISIAGLTVSVILFYSIRLANRPADIVHNYGYGKVEHVCEALEGVVLVGISLAMISQAVASFFHLKHVPMQGIGFAVSIINASINFIGASYIMKMARKSSSPAVHAEAVHYRLEGYISGMIAVSFAVAMAMEAQGLNAQAMYVDPLATVLVSIIVILPSFRIAKRSFFKLLDSSVEEESQLEILKPLNSHIDKYCEFKHIRSRTAGRNKFVELKIIMPENITLGQGYKVSSLLEKDIKAHVPNSEVMVKLEPCDRDCKYGMSEGGCPYMKRESE